MKIKNWIRIGAVGLVVFSGCSTARVRVLPGAGGENRVVARDIEKDGAEEAALKAAQEYCKDRNREAVFEADSSKYTGTMEEGTRNTVRKASKVAMILGGPGAAYGSTRAAGSAVGAAGVAGTVMTNDRDYESEVKFKCQ